MFSSVFDLAHWACAFMVCWNFSVWDWDTYVCLHFAGGSLNGVGLGRISNIPLIRWTQVGLNNVVRFPLLIFLEHLLTLTMRVSFLIDKD